jgi:hypothetical protein
MSNYPPLRIVVLQGLLALREQVQAYPDFLSNPDCPYDEATKAVLAQLFEVRTVENIVERVVQSSTGERGRPSKEIKLDNEDQRKVLDEIKKTLEQLNSMAMDATLQTGERIQVAKTKTGLLDQLLKMMERHTAVVKVEKFKEEVIGILNDLVDEKDRELFLARIEPLR